MIQLYIYIDLKLGQYLIHLSVLFLLFREFNLIPYMSLIIVVISYTFLVGLQRFYGRTYQLLFGCFAVFFLCLAPKSIISAFLSRGFSKLRLARLTFSFNCCAELFCRSKVQRDPSKSLHAMSGFVWQIFKPQIGCLAPKSCANRAILEDAGS